MRTSNHISVLTGDLVDSTDLGSRGIADAFASLGNIAPVLEDWHGAPVHMTRHRGDGWQCVLARPELALRSALAIRAALRKLGSNFDSYIGIASGHAQAEVGPDLNAEISPVFNASGNALDMAKSTDGIRFLHRDGGAVGAAFILADHLSQGWTPSQAAAILPFLTPLEAPSYTQVAERLGKSRQAVTKSAQAAGIQPLSAALASIEGAAHA